MLLSSVPVLLRLRNWMEPLLDKLWLVVRSVAPLATMEPPAFSIWPAAMTPVVSISGTVTTLVLVLPPLDVLGLLVEVSAGAVLPEPAPPPDAVKGVAPMVPVFPLALVLLRVWASMRRSCKPVWLIAPLVLRKRLAAMSSRAAASAP